jgi:hypothetical protein
MWISRCIKLKSCEIPLQQTHDQECVCRPLPSALCAQHARNARLNCTTCKIGGPRPFLQIDTYPQIPVLRISTTTSPSAGTAPDWMSAEEGSASSIHRLCCGSVYTPMLGFRLKSEDIDESRNQRYPWEIYYVATIRRAASRENRSKSLVLNTQQRTHNSPLPSD